MEEAGRETRISMIWRWHPFSDPLHVQGVQCICGVSFLCKAECVHCCREVRKRTKNKQIVFVGSEI